MLRAHRLEHVRHHRVDAPTIDVLTNGLNGMCQSSRLGGSITTSFGSNIVVGTGTTFTTTDYQVGDTIFAGGVVQRIVSIQSATQMTVLNNYQQNSVSSTHYRGGASFTSLAPLTTYYLYAIGDISLLHGFVLSTRNTYAGDTLVGVPTGYSNTFVRQTPLLLRHGRRGMFYSLPVPDQVVDTSVGVFLAPANQTEVRAQQTRDEGGSRPETSPT